MLDDLERKKPLPTHPLDGLCEVHKVHAPHVHQLHVHHEWPLGMGGPDVAGNTVSVCPTGHTSVHEALRYMIENGGRRPPRSYGYHPAEVALAALGYEQWVRAGRPGNPVLEWHWHTPQEGA